MPRIDPTRLTELRLRDLPSGASEASAILAGPAEWYRFASAYRDAADELARIIAKDPWRHAALAAPMLFLYRHSIELHLKSLLIDAGELLDAPQDIPPRHYLRELWKRVRALLLRISPESDGEWFERADQVIADFEALDQGSFSCRYPVDTKGQPSLPKDFRVEADVVRQIVGELGILLHGASTQIDVYMDYKHEMYRDAAG